MEDFQQQQKKKKKKRKKKKHCQYSDLFFCLNNCVVKVNMDKSERTNYNY